MGHYLQMNSVTTVKISEKHQINRKIKIVKVVYINILLMYFLFSKFPVI